MIIMPNDFAVVTIVTRNYLHYARALARSIADVSPDVPVFICLADRPPVGALATNEIGRCFFADELPIANWRRFAFQYTPFELACALKPFALEHVGKMGFKYVAYFDADVQFYHPLDNIASVARNHHIVMTPHLTDVPDLHGQHTQEQTILRAGIYNGGFIAIDVDATGESFLSWWKRKCLTWCFVDLASGIFVDQRWLDLVPGLFPKVHVERDPGWNVGHWNLLQRTIEQQNDRTLTVCGQPFLFYHFSGWKPDNPKSVSVYQQHLIIEEHSILEKLTVAYAERLDELGRRECETWGCEYDCLSNAMSIRPAWREAIRMQHSALQDVDDPFDLRAFPGLLTRLRSAEPEAERSRQDWRFEWLEHQLVELNRRIHEVGNRTMLGWLLKGLRLLRAHVSRFRNETGRVVRAMTK